MNIDLLRQYALSFVGKPYIYGGKTPLVGLDCSGLVSEILKAARILGPHDDLNAQALYDKLAQNGSWGVYKAGSLAFYGKSTKEVSHVVFLIDQESAIGANGGKSTTLSLQDAITDGAFVNIRHVDFRADKVAVIRPFYTFEGRI